MKKITTLFLLLLLFAACQNGINSNRIKKFPKPGTVVASAEMPVTKDKLNKFNYTIKVIADTDITDGVYDVSVNYEYHASDGFFTMPKGGEDFLPIIRAADKPYTYIIGFKVPGDTTFHDYFQVTATDANIRMEYIMGYTFN